MNDKPAAAGKSSFDLIDSAKVFAMMDVEPGSTFLDLACGIGNYSIAMAKNMKGKGVIYSIDLWRESIESLDQEIETKGIKNIKPMVADIREKLPFEENSVDACLLATVLHDLSKNDQKAILKEIARVVKPGGMVNILEFKKIDKGPGPPAGIRMHEEDVENLVAPYGFRKVDRGEVGEFNYLLKYKSIR